MRLIARVICIIIIIIHKIAVKNIFIYNLNIATYKQMLIKFFLVLFLSLLTTNSISAKVSAQLSIITYQPIYFNLTFSQPITPLPKFQLLFNQIPIRYVVTEVDQKSQYYIINGITEGIVNPADNITEKYVLMFTEPLLIANGNFNLNSFLLRAKQSQLNSKYILQPIAEKGSHYKYQNQTQILNALAIIIVSIVYFLSYTTLIGINAFNFIAIYTFISLQSSLFTALDYKIAFYLLFEAHQLATDNSQLYYLVIPHIIITFSFVVGLICRWGLKNLSQKSGICNYIYYYLSYKFFIISWQIMCLPILANLIHLIQDTRHYTMINQNFIKIYLYFSSATIVFYSYMAYFTVNPQIGQSPQKWQKYIQTSHFQMFDGFHLGIDAKDWKKRNYTLIASLIRLIIVIFVSAKLTSIPNLLMQIIYLIYLFTTRPFKYDFFNFINIGIQIFVIVFYLYRYIVQLYMGISDEIVTSTDVTRILLTNIILLCTIAFSYFVLGIYQFYQRIRSFKINLNTWNRQLKYARRQSVIRKVKHSAFRRQDQNQAHLIKKNKSQRRLRNYSEKKQTNDRKQVDVQYRRKSPSYKQTGQKLDKMGASRPPKAIKDTKQMTNISNFSQQKQKQVKKQKMSKKIKQKSSLLKNISLGNQSP